MGSTEASVGVRRRAIFGHVADDFSCVHEAILDLRLQRLTALGREEIKAELDKLADEIADYLEILRSRARIQGMVKDELKAVKDEFATPRRTTIVDQEGEMEDEDLIQREDMVVTVSHLGYVKRVPLSTYRAQRRGGKGRSGMATREEDFVSRLFVASTHTPVLFFSSRGRVYKEKIWRLPEATPQSRGKAMINLLPLEQGELITSIMPLPEDETIWSNFDVMFATTRGTVRRNKLSDFVDVRRSGIIAMKLDEGKSFVDVQICTEKDDVLLTAAGGQCIRFAVTDVRVFSGRTSMGVRGINLGEGDKVISLSILRHVEATPAERAAYLKQSSAIRRAATGEEPEAEETTVEAEDGADNDVSLAPERYADMGAAEQFVLTVTELGFGKRSSSYQFRVSGRGGKGIRASDPTKLKEIGTLVAAFPVEMSDEIMLVSNGGQLIRVPVEGIRFTSRASKGVRVFNTAEGERVVSVERLSESEAGEENGNGG